MRKNNKQVEMKNFIKECMEFFGCKQLNIISGKDWYGDYGHVCNLCDDGSLEFCNINIKTIYKVLKDVWYNNRIHQDNRICISDKFHYKVLNIFKNAHYHNKCGDLYILENGQLYDAFNLYWYDIHDSKILKKLLKNGYTYGGPSNYFEYQYPEPEYNDSSNCDEESYWVEE